MIPAKSTLSQCRRNAGTKMTSRKTAMMSCIFIIALNVILNRSIITPPAIVPIAPAGISRRPVSNSDKKQEINMFVEGCKIRFMVKRKYND